MLVDSVLKTLGVGDKLSKIKSSSMKYILCSSVELERGFLCVGSGNDIINICGTEQLLDCVFV